MAALKGSDPPNVLAPRYLYLPSPRLFSIRLSSSRFRNHGLNGSGLYGPEDLENLVALGIPFLLSYWPGGLFLGLEDLRIFLSCVRDPARQAPHYFTFVLARSGIVIKCLRELTQQTSSSKPTVTSEQ